MGFPWKDKNGTPITNTFQKRLDESNQKLKHSWVDGGSEF